MRRSTSRLAAASIFLFALAGCSDDPILFWPIGDTANSDTGGGDVAADAQQDTAESDAESDTSEDTVQPDVAEPDAADPDVVEPDVAEPDVGEPDVGEPDVVEDTEPDPEPDVGEPDVVEDVEPDPEPDVPPMMDCDDGGLEYVDCQECQEVELDTGGCCIGAANDCTSNADCVSILECLGACGGDIPCAQDCFVEFPDGSEAYQALAFCVVGDGSGGAACGDICS